MYFLLPIHIKIFDMFHVFTSGYTTPQNHISRTPPPDFRDLEIFEKFPVGSLLHDPTKKYVEDIKEYVRNMKEWVKNRNKYVRNMKEYVGDIKEYVENMTKYSENVKNMKECTGNMKKYVDMMDFAPPV